MSGIALAWVATVTVGNQTAKQLLQFYAGHNFGKPGFEFKNATLAKQLEVTERSIRNAHKLLLDKGFLIKEERYNKEGRQLTNFFALNIPNSFVDNFMGEGEVRSSLGGKHVPGEGETSSSLINNNINNKENNKEPKEVKKVEKKIELPEWIEQQDWDDYRQHRKDMKKPMNANTEKRAIQKLAKIKKNGHIVKEIINETIINGWVGFFEPKKQGNGVVKPEIRSTVPWYNPTH